MECIKDRIKQFADYLGKEVGTLERETGAGRNNMKGPSDPGAERVIVPLLREYPQLSPDWLLTGDGTMLRSLREHPSVITATVPVDSSSGKDATEKTFADLDDPDVQAALNPFVGVAESPHYYGAKSPDITLPLNVYEELLHQLNIKDKQLADAAAQIRSLLTLLNTPPTP